MRGWGGGSTSGWPKKWHFESSTYWGITDLGLGPIKTAIVLDIRIILEYREYRKNLSWMKRWWLLRKISNQGLCRKSASSFTRIYLQGAQKFLWGPFNIAFAPLWTRHRGITTALMRNSDRINESEQSSPLVSIRQYPSLGRGSWKLEMTFLFPLFLAILIGSLQANEEVSLFFDD